MEQHTLTVSERTHRLAGIALISGLVSSVVIISNFGPYALISSLSGSTKNLGNAAAAIAPDLVVTNTTNVTGYSQSNITLPGTITNTGTNNITNSVPLFKTYYWVDTDIVHTPNVATWGTQSSAINTIPPFDIGATQDVSATYTAPAVSQITTYYYRFCTDWTGDVSELDEGNNCSNWQTITINPPTIVCTPNTTTAAPNQNVTWTATVYGLPGSLNYSWSVTGGIPASKFTTTSAGQSTFTSKFTSGGNYAPVGLVSTNPAGVGEPAQEFEFSCSPTTVSGPVNSCGAGGSASINVTPNRFVSGGSTRIDYNASGLTQGTTCTVSAANIGGAGVNSITSTSADNLCNVTTGSVTLSNIQAQLPVTITCGGVTLYQSVANILPKFIEF